LFAPSARSEAPYTAPIFYSSITCQSDDNHKRVYLNVYSSSLVPLSTSYCIRHLITFLLSFNSCLVYSFFVFNIDLFIRIALNSTSADEHSCVAFTRAHNVLPSLNRILKIAKSESFLFLFSSITTTRFNVTLRNSFKAELDV